MELLPVQNADTKSALFEGSRGSDDPDPWLSGYFLVSNSTSPIRAGSTRNRPRTEDITDRKRAEENTARWCPAFRKAYLSPRPRGASWIHDALAMTL